MTPQNIEATWSQFAEGYPQADRLVNGPAVDERAKYEVFLKTQFGERNEAALRVLRDSLEHGLQRLVQRPTQPAAIGLLMPGLDEAVEGARGRIVEEDPGFVMAACSDDEFQQQVEIQVGQMRQRLLEVDLTFGRVSYPKVQSFVGGEGGLVGECQVVKGNLNTRHAGHRGGDYIFSYRGIHKDKDARSQKKMRDGREHFRYMGQVPRSGAEWGHRFGEVNREVLGLLKTVIDFKRLCFGASSRRPVAGGTVQEVSAAYHEFDESDVHGSDLRRHILEWLYSMDAICEFAWLVEQLTGLGWNLPDEVRELVALLEDATEKVPVLSNEYQRRQELVAWDLLFCYGQSGDRVLVCLHSKYNVSRF